MTALSAVETKALARLESIVETNLRGFLAAGKALAEIRKRRLYRATHRSFEGYCRERWGMSRQNAAALIAQSEVGQKAASTLAGSSPPSQRQALALAALSPELQRQVLQTTATSGYPLTSELKRLVDDVKDRQAQEVQEEEARRAASRKSCPRPFAELPRRDLLARIEELVARLEKLCQRVDRSQGVEAVAERLQRLAGWLRGE